MPSECLEVGETFATKTNKAIGNTKTRKKVFKMAKMGKKATKERMHQYSCFSSEKLASGSKDTAILPKWVETVNRCACNGERLWKRAGLAGNAR